MRLTVVEDSLRSLTLAATTQQRLGIAVVAVMVVGWLLYIALSVRRRDVPLGVEMELAPNRKPYYDDEDLEGPRLNQALKVSFILLVVSAVGLPLYWMREPSRQEGADRGFLNRSVNRGHSLYLPTDSPEHGAHFGCQDCHGPEGVGGVAPYTLSDPLNPDRPPSVVRWAAPPLNDVLHRFSREEVRSILVYGRPNTPMPAWGIDGGGPMNAQQIDDLVNYIESIQLTADEAKAQHTETAEKYAADVEGKDEADGETYFKLHCARCHTKGWSYDDPEEMAGGAFGPNLRGGVTLRQFPDVESMIEFITLGSDFQKPYGTRGIGSGRMPGFAGMLTPEQIEAIVEYERSL